MDPDILQVEASAGMARVAQEIGAEMVLLHL